MSSARHSQLDREELSIQQRIRTMAEQVDKAVGDAMRALSKGDRALAEELIADDALINELQQRIEEECMATIATQQPVASDLRLLLAGIHIADELERIADHAADIGRIVLRMEEAPQSPFLSRLEEMSREGRALLNRVMDAYTHHDMDEARRVASDDEAIDRLQEQMFGKLIGYMDRDPERIRHGTYLLWTVHNLERIGDRVTNIAERIIFMATGEILDLNR